MALPPDFIFSQNNLQAFVDCPRRFELAFIQRLRWPAVQVEPVQDHERHLELGARFHRLVFQHRQGLPEEILTAGIQDPDLGRWWGNYLKFAPRDLPPEQRAEFDLSMPFAGFRLMARYDLLAFKKSDHAVIVDWKTTIRKTRPEVLAPRVQSRLYPFILANGRELTGGVPPDQISMHYWFPNFPSEPEVFQYSEEKFARDREFFTGLIDTISSTPEGSFALADDPHPCAFCVYRSLCARGQAAGKMDGDDGEVDESGSLFDQFDLDHIDGIAF